MQRPINTFPIPSGIRSKLNSNGYDIADDLKNVTAVTLSKEIDISLEDATAVLNEIQQLTDGNSSTFSLLDLLKQEKHNRPIITFSKKLDEMLGGGIPVSKITEICGPPGIGKTQLCLQTCVDVQIPKEFGGLGEEAVYIDTEGAFTIDRLKDIANASIQHCNFIAKQQNNIVSVNAAKNFTLTSVLDKIHYFRCNDYIQLIATINFLPDFISIHPLIRLITIDSVAFPFRVQFEGKVNVRTRILSEFSQILMQMAAKYTLAIVTTNQMTTKFENEGKSSLIPALGETWGHACTLRLILSYQGIQRFATLNKSPFREEKTVQFQITTAGIRDVTNDKPQIVIKNINKRQMKEDNMNNNKKMKNDD